MARKEKDDALHPITPTTAMAQEHVCFYADFFQQSFAGNELFDAHAYCVCIILSDFK